MIRPISDRPEIVPLEFGELKPDGDYRTILKRRREERADACRRHQEFLKKHGGV